MSINRFECTGRLTRDAETKFTAGGKQVTTFTLAVDRMGKDAGADFINFQAWDKLAEILAKLTKGRKIYVAGRLQIRQYEAKDGGKRYATEVIVREFEYCDSKQQEQAQGAEQFGKVAESDGVPF